MKEYRLSKSKIMSGWQCEKRLYLEIHHPELAEVSGETGHRLEMGTRVGEAARELFPEGILIDTGNDLGQALSETGALLSRKKPVTLFEGTFQHNGVLIRADIFHSGPEGRRLVEVKSSARVKHYHLPDVAIQYWVLKGAGFEPDTVALCHVDTSFVYPGNNDYRGLFTEAEVTEEARAMLIDVDDRVKTYKKMLHGDVPAIAMGDRCTDPFDCPFTHHCSAGTVEPEYPVTLLPRGGAAADRLLELGITDLRQACEDQLDSELHKKVWRVTVSGRPEVDAAELEEILDHPFPRYYLDFESIQFTVPIWAGTRPYQQIPFQWSCHIDRGNGMEEHREFLDTSGRLPVKPLAESLIAAVGTSGPIYVYGAFESMVLNGLAEMLPELSPELREIRSRLFNLLTVSRRAYYHPEMKGSWSIKAVLPTIAPGLDYDNLEVQHGAMAQEAYLEAIHPDTTGERRHEIRLGLLAYCARDTEGLIAMTTFFRNWGRTAAIY
jgi:hypothetical protein